MKQQVEHELDGTNVQLIVSDPWDFVTELGSGPFKARIVQLDNSSPPQMLLELEQPIDYRDRRCDFLVASPRHTDDSLADLLAGRSIHINARGIGRSEIAKGNRFGSTWRGGLALIADLQKTGSERR